MSTSRDTFTSGESPEAYANWLEVDRSPHAIQFYSDEEVLLDSISRFVSTALKAGDFCFVLATKAHLEEFAERLKARGVNINRLVEKGRYVAMDAFQVLAQLMVDGKLDKTRLDEFIREVLLPLKAAAKSKLKRVAACGEVVALLLEDGKAEAALELERCWNELAAQGSYCLRCFYRIPSFSDRGQNELFLKLCAEHASVIPGESQLRSVAPRVKEVESSPHRK
jgi:hypothetical protein